MNDLLPVKRIPYLWDMTLGNQLPMLWEICCTFSRNVGNRLPRDSASYSWSPETPRSDDPRTRSRCQHPFDGRKAWKASGRLAQKALQQLWRCPRKVKTIQDMWRCQSDTVLAAILYRTHMHFSLHMRNSVLESHLQEPRTHVHFSTARCTLRHECIKRVVGIDCAQLGIVSNIEAVSLKARDVV